MWGGGAAHTSRSLEDDHEQVVRLNVREPGAGAQLPLSCRPARYAHTSQIAGFGLGAAHDGWHARAVKQAKHCSESTCSFQVAVKGASTSSGTLRAAPETMWHRPVQKPNAARGASGRVFCHARTQMPLKVSAGSRAPASSGKTAPPAPLGELVGGGGAINRLLS